MADRRSIETPTLLRDTHELEAFDSGEAVLNEWLRKRALHDLQTAASRTYVACETGAPRVIAFYALSMGQILAQEVPGSMRRNMPKQIFAVVLGRLAIDRRWQGRGLGRVLLADAVRRSQLAATEVSARVILVHAISAAAEAFYQHHGFTRLPVEAPLLALDLAKLDDVQRRREGDGEAPTR